jgi:hypothetical protein
LIRIKYGADQLSEIKRMIDAENSDLFDVLAYVAFALSPITRIERVDHHFLPCYEKGWKNKTARMLI